MLQNVRPLFLLLRLLSKCFLADIDSIADVQNRTLMGPQQEACQTHPL